MATRTPGRSSQRGSSQRRGFAAMSPMQRRRIAAMGGRASHGGHSQNEEYDENRRTGRGGNERPGYDKSDYAESDYAEDRDERSMRGGGGGGGGEDYDDDYNENEGYDDGDDCGYLASSDEDQEDDYSLDRERRYSSSSEREDDDNQRRSRSGHGRQGFASMDPEERRRVARMGGRASHGGHSRNGRSSSRSQRR